ncbi:hypothetical protein KKB64_01065 [Patescibacteria group bacterium]|nr:hypothetical protein [Patescibacteria group bacterium]MBU1472365.1 hypothetical protein [Patescibacteria group bacterium]MBU2460071.1 hypothetical protein [Patescibacteria group bacterium]
MANIGSEVERALKWKEKRNNTYSLLAFHRALELVDLTLALPYPLPKLRELSRTREALVDYFAGDNHYHSSDVLWQKYIFAFTLAAQMQRKPER